MDNDVVKFDPSKLMDGVRDRIKATFVALIPDAEWEGLVKKEVDAFFEPIKHTYSSKTERVYNSYSRKDEEQKNVTTVIETSPFRAMVWDFCYTKVTEILKGGAMDTYFTNTWENGMPKITDAMKEVVAEAAPAALVDLIQHISRGSAEVIRQQLQNIR